MIDEMTETLSGHGSGGIAGALSLNFNTAMQVEPQHAVGAAPYQRAEEVKRVCQSVERQNLVESGRLDPTEGASCSGKIGVLFLLN
jgi:hypothetical protein